VERFSAAHICGIDQKQAVSSAQMSRFAATNGGKKRSQDLFSR
jgi:hypothetical protein